MISVAEARARLLADLSPTPPEVVPLAAAWGRVAAAPVRARLTQPPADVSAMDGYALRAADGREGAQLRVVGAAPAGHPYEGPPIGPGETVRLFTGSVVPAGADAILLQEDAERTDATVVVRETVITGRHIRRAGQDFAAGDTLIKPGRRLGARDIGLAAAGNHPWLAVHRRPRVGILATGDEIALPGEPIPPGGIVSSNSHALAALVTAAGGAPVVLPVAPDDAAAIGAVTAQTDGLDLLLTSGGASVGDHDLVVSALKARGLVVDFWKVAMRPGKPLMAGTLNRTPVLGLPGNPVSSMVCALLFAWPMLLRLSGAAAAPLPEEQAVLGAPLRANDHRADFMRSTVTDRPDGVPVVTPFPVQDSGMLSRLAHADALLLRAPHAPAAETGDPVSIIRLNRFGL